MSSGSETRGAGQGFGPRPPGTPRPDAPSSLLVLRGSLVRKRRPSRCAWKSRLPRLYLASSPPLPSTLPPLPVSLLRPSSSAAPRRQKAPETVSFFPSFVKSLESLLGRLRIARLKTSADTFSSSQALIFQVWESLTVYFISLHGQIDCYFTLNFPFPSLLWCCPVDVATEHLSRTTWATSPEARGYLSVFIRVNEAPFLWHCNRLLYFLHALQQLRESREKTGRLCLMKHLSVFMSAIYLLIT